MSFNHEIAKYRIIHMGKREKYEDYVAEIKFHNDRNQFVGVVRFYTYDQELPPNKAFEWAEPKSVRITMRA